MAFREASWRPGRTLAAIPDACVRPKGDADDSLYITLKAK